MVQQFFGQWHILFHILTLCQNNDFDPYKLRSCFRKKVAQLGYSREKIGAVPSNVRNWSKFTALSQNLWHREFHHCQIFLTVVSPTS